MPRINCDEESPVFCLDRVDGKNYEGEYVGHDEPQMIFYSNVPGSGNQSIYTLVLPKDPPVKPRQDGAGGTYNFQLHPTFWFGMALCDNQSAPRPNKNVPCVPNTDSNALNNTNFLAPDYIGNHPGTAFLELQFYPPGWINTPGVSVTNAYYAALNIFSFSVNPNSGQANNLDCRQKVGDEPGNFAILTRNGIPLEAANALGTPFGNANPNLGNVFLMIPGDKLRITITDTVNGVLTLVEDLTTGQFGFMFAGPSAGFGQVNFDPAAKTCTVNPYTFRAMYSTSSEDTRIPWASHSGNIAFSDEIGHFEFCDAFNINSKDPNFLKCTKPGADSLSLTPDDDDFLCANPAFFGLPSAFIPITGCIGEDSDFDGTAYRENWPGTGRSWQNELLHPTPIQVSSPRFTDPSGALRNYERMAFETNLPAITRTCNTKTGQGCQGLPANGAFYPIFSTMPSAPLQCLWQFGGPNIPSMVNNFGGTAASEYGGLATQVYPSPQGGVFRQNVYRNIITNPCQSFGPI